MSRKVITAMMAVALIALVVPASAHRYHRVDDGHPLRVIAHIVHPIGIALEYGIMRPIHSFVSKDNNDITFGHKAYMADEGTFDEWVQGDYDPSIAVERQARLTAAYQMAQ